MISEKGSKSRDAAEPKDSAAPDSWADMVIQCPGLSPGAGEIDELSRDLPKRMAVFSYKRSTPCFWIIFIGGTGTGKSTLFNAFCGRGLSETGVERPKTSGPVVYAHEARPLERQFPFPHMEVDIRPPGEKDSGPVRGRPGHLLILQHRQEDRSHLAVVDTPDLDSVEAENRRFAEDLYLLADTIVFVTSQEKYADEVPFQFLEKVLRDSKPYYFLLNKVQEGISREDVAATLETQGVSLSRKRIWLIPYTSQNDFSRISRDGSFLDFSSSLSQDLAGTIAGPLRKEAYARQRQDVRTRIERLMELLDHENRAAQSWIAALEDLFRKATRGLEEEEKERYAARSREYLKAEIRRLFNRYDLLARPRRLLQALFLEPLRILGVTKGGPGRSPRKELMKVRQRIDLGPVRRILEGFNASVLKTLPPSEQTAPLFRALRRPELVLSEREIMALVLENQGRLEAWLEKRFQRLSEELPRRKKWGIYSASILWGILILSFETVVGGGFTILDAALDSALAPFVTKGTVELFAYQEIQKITRELATRYQEGLASVVAVQRDRYRACLESLSTTSGTMEKLRSFYESIPDSEPDHLGPR